MADATEVKTELATQTETPKTAGTTDSPEWLPARLESARKAERAAVLKELDLPDVETGKKAAAELKARTEAEKSAEQRAIEFKNKFEAEAAQVAKLSASVTEQAARMMIGLTELQKEAVQRIAGDDPLARVNAITALQTTWAAKEASDKAEAEAKAKADAKNAPAAKDTSPARGAAPEGLQTSPPNHRAVFETLRTKDPFAAAAYAEANPDAYKST